MPIYEFICRACRAQFESLMSPNEPVQCKYCRHAGCEKVVTAPAVYKIKGDNSASTSPRAANAEMDRRLAKRERLDVMSKKQGIDLGYSKGED